MKELKHIEMGQCALFKRVASVYYLLTINDEIVASS